MADYYFIWDAFKNNEKGKGNYEVVKKTFDSEEEFYKYCFYEVMGKENWLAEDENGQIFTEEEYKKLISQEDNCFYLGTSSWFEYAGGTYLNAHRFYKDVLVWAVENCFTYEDISFFMDTWQWE